MAATHPCPREAIIARFPARTLVIGLLAATLTAPAVGTAAAVDRTGADRPTGAVHLARSGSPDAALREAAADAHRRVRGTTPPATRGRDAQAATTSQAEFIGNNFFDGCSDDVFDLKKFSIIDNQADELVYLWGTCPQTVAPSGGFVIFFIDDGSTPEGTPSLVLVQSTDDASWTLFETGGSQNDNDWVVIQEGVGSVSRVGRDDGGPRDVGQIEIDAVEANFPTRYQIAVATDGGGGDGDLLPDVDMPPVIFPFSCDFFELHSARIAPERAVLRAAATAAVAATGDHSVVRQDGTVLAWPVDDAQLASLDALPGLTATRPVMFEAFADPEPTQWAVDQTNLAAAWDAVPRALGTIAVLDQGVDGTRPDLVGRVGPGFNAITGQLYTEGADSALGPHGTSVSGIAVGNRDNNEEVAGVNDGATVLPVRVFDHASCAEDASIAAGLDWAVSRGADIINLSLGGPGSSNVLQNAVERAVDAGVIVIAATGNDDEFAPGRESFPAAYPGVIGIGATGPDGVASYSQRAAVEYVAPGGSLSGLRESDYAVLTEWDRIEYQAGTSFAAPFAAGLVSLWLARNPGATLEDVRAALNAVAIDLPGTRDGRGLLDAAALLEPFAFDRVDPAPPIDGDARTTHRLDHDDPVAASLAVSALRFPEAGTAPVAVIARRDTFADALSGAPLTRDGPLLFTDSTFLDDGVREELGQVLAPGATIYLLGGPNALAPRIEDDLRATFPDAAVVRLAGNDRFQTSRVIVDETVARYGPATQILLARGFGPVADPNGTAAWADAIAGGAFAASRAWPLLIVQSGGLTSTDLQVIDRSVQPNGIVNLLGGPAALSPAVFDAAATVRTTRRIAGENRDATAAAIARTLWGVSPTGPRNHVLLNVRTNAGWYLGLAAAGYAASINAPVLSVNRASIPVETSPFLERCGAAQVETWLAGADSQISNAIAIEVDRRDGGTCG